LPPVAHASDAIVISVVVLGTVLAAAIDLRTRRVPNALTAAIAVAGFAVAAAGLGRVTLLAALAGCVVGAALMLPGHMWGKTGAGDMKLLAATGALLGAGGTVRAFLYTAIAGGVLALVVAVHRRRLGQTLGRAARLVASGSAAAEAVEAPDAGNRFAYAPAIAVGSVLAVLGW
jgi:prepilin peptidase CpaA